MMIDLRCGSGLAISFLDRELASLNIISLATDLNFDACKACLRTASINKTRVEVIGSAYFHGLRLRGCIDIIVCNPPYVPTEETYSASSTRFENDPLSAAWIGGPNGRQMIDELIPVVSVTLTILQSRKISRTKAFATFYY